MEGVSNSVTRSLSMTQFIFAAAIFILHVSTWTSTEAATPQELQKGFKASPDSSNSAFQSLLNDPTGNFSLGFRRVNKDQLALVILHLPSSEQLWTVDPPNPPPWSDRTQIFFNGSLVISDTNGKVFWSTETDGNRVVLLNSSNLQVQQSSNDGGGSPAVLWQSFDFPSDTLVENQNFTSAMTLISSNGNGRYSMRLGVNFIGFYAQFKTGTNQMYFKHTALEAKAQILEGGGPIYIRVNSDGYLGMYQNGSTPVDVEAFNSFQKQDNGLLRVKLGSDGNFNGFYWDGSTWLLNYQAIKEKCELPSACGSYGLCNPQSGCSCLVNDTVSNSGQCLLSGSGDFCGSVSSFLVLRKTGVELPYKELMGFKTGFSLDECESSCEENCKCWGSVYNNASGFCYSVEYPIQTLVRLADETKVGYFKVRKTAVRSKIKVGFGVGLGVLGLVVGISIGVAGFVGYRMWVKGKKRRGVSRFFDSDEAISPGPYKDLGAASFKSIQMT